MRTHPLTGFALVALFSLSVTASPTLDFLDPFLSRQGDGQVGGGAGVGGGLSAAGEVSSGIGDAVGFDASGSLAASKQLSVGNNLGVNQPVIVSPVERTRDCLWNKVTREWEDFRGLPCVPPQQPLPQQPLPQQPLPPPVPIQAPCAHGGPGPIGPGPMRHGPPQPGHGNGPYYQRHGRSQQNKDLMKEETNNATSKNKTDSMMDMKGAGHKRSTSGEEREPVLAVHQVEFIPLSELNASNDTRHPNLKAPGQMHTRSIQELQEHKANSTNATEVDKHAAATHKQVRTIIIDRDSHEKQKQQLKTNATNPSSIYINDDGHDDERRRRDTHVLLMQPQKVNATNATNISSGSDRTVSPKLSGVAHMFHNMLAG